MTHTVTKVGVTELRGRQIVQTFDIATSSYTTGGEALTLAELQMGRIETIEVDMIASGYVTQWDKSLTAPKFLSYRQTAATSALVEVPATTDVGTYRVTVIGRR